MKGVSKSFGDGGVLGAGCLTFDWLVAECTGKSMQGPWEYVCAASRRLIDAAKQTETEVLRTL